MLSIVRPPQIIKNFYKDFVWTLPADNNKIYLTFDDGPVPGPTEFVLDQLKQFSAKGTFFCVGNNVKKNRGLYQRILDEGHTTGNHTFNHVNGWMSNSETYLHEVEQAASLIDSKLFRPPYGRIRKQQAQSLLKNYKIIMWDVLTYDFNVKVSPAQCLKNVTENTRPGSIIVFHDSVKAFKNLEYALPRSLEFFKKKNFQLMSLL